MYDARRNAFVYHRHGDGKKTLRLLEVGGVESFVERLDGIVHLGTVAAVARVLFLSNQYAFFSGFDVGHGRFSPCSYTETDFFFEGSTRIGRRAPY